NCELVLGGSFPSDDWKRKSLVLLNLPAYIFSARHFARWTIRLALESCLDKGLQQITVDKGLTDLSYEVAEAISMVRVGFMYPKGACPLGFESCAMAIFEMRAISQDLFSHWENLQVCRRIGSWLDVGCAYGKVL